MSTSTAGRAPTTSSWSIARGTRHIDCSRRAADLFPQLRRRRRATGPRPPCRSSTSSPCAAWRSKRRRKRPAVGERAQRGPVPMSKIGLAVIGLGPAVAAACEEPARPRRSRRGALGREPQRASAPSLRAGASPSRSPPTSTAAIADPAVDAVLVLTPPSSPSRGRRALLRGRQARAGREAAGGHRSRARERLVEAGRAASGRRLRRRAAASLPARRACACGSCSARARSAASRPRP